MTVNVKQGVVDAISESNNDYGGFHQTRLTAPIVAGQTVWPVESLYNWPESGTVITGGQRYTYTGRSLTALEGIQYTDGADTFNGAARALPQEMVITDYTRARTGLDLLRRAMLVNYAEGSDLSALGRNLGVNRLPSIPDDELFRNIIKALAYNPRGTVYGLELFLDAALGPGNYEIIENLIEEPNKVIINLLNLNIGDQFEGRTFLSGPEFQLAAGLTTVTIENPIVTVGSKTGALHTLRLKDEDHTSDFRTALPSVDSLVEYEGDAGTLLWTYEGPSEVGDVTQLTNNQGIEIADTSNAAPARYVHELRIQPESYASVNVVTLMDGGSTFGGAGTQSQWGAVLTDGAFRMAWGVIDNGSNLDLGLTTAVGAFVDGVARTLDYDTYYAIELRKYGTDRVELYVDGMLVQRVNYSEFTNASATTRIRIGSNNTVQDTHVGRFKQCGFVSRTVTDYLAGRGAAGETTGTGGIDRTLDTNDPIFTAPDLGKRVQISGGTASGGRNNGVFEIEAVATAEELLLRGPLQEGAFVESANPNDFNAVGRPFTFPDDIGKVINITSGLNSTTDGSGGGNHIITALIDPDDGVSDLASFATPLQKKTGLAVCAASNFVTESGIDWRLNPDFVTETGLLWEVSNLADEAAQTITLRQDLPTLTAALVVEVVYSQVLSAQLLEDSTLVNNLSDPGPPREYDYYPFYLADPAGFIRTYVDLITAAGVIPEFTGV